MTIGNDPWQVLALHGVEEDEFHEQATEQWEELGHAVEFNFPYLLADLLYAAADADPDPEQVARIARLSDDVFRSQWAFWAAEHATRRMVFGDDERVAKQVRELAAWVREGRRRGLMSPVPPPQPRDDRNDLREAVTGSILAAAGVKEPTNWIDLLRLTGKTLGEVHKAACGLTVTELVELQAASGLDWPAFIDSRLGGES